MASRRLRALVRGRVQGVGFRFATLREARRLGLVGWVRNVGSATVEVDAEGDEARLRDLLVFLNRGPLGAHVESVSEEWLPASGSASLSFEVRRSE